MSLREIYTQVILDHYRKPRNKGKLEDATHTSRCDNPLCGDKVSLYLRLDGERIAEIRFDGVGCAISQASASIMTQILKGKTIEESMKIEQEFRRMLLSQDHEPDINILGDLVALAGVRKLHARVKCATCAWHALDAALKGVETVSTETSDDRAEEGEIELADWEKSL